MTTERRTVHPKDRAAWRAWLDAHYTEPAGVWLVLDKGSSGASGLSYEEAVEEALCVGWIDSRPNTLDEHRYQQLFSPRKSGSPWSKLNKTRVERLTHEGRMGAAGLAALAAAKADGSWTAYDRIEALQVPGDLRRALKERPEAQRHFEAFPPSSKKNILWWIESAKRPETRAKRIEETVRLAEDDIRANHWRR
jgi:uncharacterized protein YdeI (YjbR/CyaY-like superfamily)